MADYIIVNGELYHYGVKGMKWGVRKDKNRSTSAGNRRFKSASDSDAHLMSRVKGQDDVDGWADLWREIHKKSGYFYEGVGVSSAFKKAIDKYDSTRKELDEKYDTSSKFREASNRLDECIKEINPNAYKLNFDRYYRIRQRAEKDPLYKQLKQKYSEAVREKNSEWNSFRRDFDDEIAGIVLTDLGYENTPKGRQFLLDNMLIFDD